MLYQSRKSNISINSKLLKFRTSPKFCLPDSQRTIRLNSTRRRPPYYYRICTVESIYESANLLNARPLRHLTFFIHSWPSSVTFTNAIEVLRFCPICVYRPIRLWDMSISTLDSILSHMSIKLYFCNYRFWLAGCEGINHCSSKQHI